MTRIKGNKKIVANFEVELGQPLDARVVVPVKSDLQGLLYAYKGLIVVVTDDPFLDNNGGYLCTEPYDLFNPTTTPAFVKVIDESGANLDDYVLKVTGKDLSSNDYTTTEKNKLASINNQYRGTYTSLLSLKITIPVAEPGDNAIVDDGVSRVEYVWDHTSGDWLLGTSTPITTDQSIIEGSINPVAGGAVHGALADKVDKAAGKSLVNDADIAKIHEPGSDDQDLSNLVVKEAGKGLSTNDYIDADKIKLGLLSEHYKGTFISYDLLVATIEGDPGDYAIVDPGIGTDSVQYIWDVSDSKWIISGGSGEIITVGNIEVWLENIPYVAGNTFVSYVNPLNPDPKYTTPQIWRCTLSTLAGESPETHPSKWEFNGTEIQVVNDNTSKVYMDGVNIYSQLSAVTGYKHGDNVVFNDRNSVMEFDQYAELGAVHDPANHIYLYIIKPNDWVDPLKGGWVEKSATDRQRKFYTNAADIRSQARNYPVDGDVIDLSTNNILSMTTTGAPFTDNGTTVIIPEYPLFGLPCAFVKVGEIGSGGGAGGGHIIADSDEQFTQQPILKFSEDFVVTNDTPNTSTHISKRVTYTESDTAPLLPKVNDRWLDTNPTRTPVEYTWFIDSNSEGYWVNWDSPSTSTGGASTATDLSVDATGFNGNLSPTDTNQQLVNKRLDNLVLSGLNLSETPIAFTNIIPLDKMHNRIVDTVVASDIIIAPNTATALENGACVVNLIGNGLNSIQISGFENIGNLVFSNILNTNNVIYFSKVAGIYQYSILFQGTITDQSLVAPTLVSLSVINTSKNTIRLETSKLLNNASVPLAGDFSCNFNTVSSLAIVGTYVLLTCASNFDFGQIITLSYTSAAGREIKDLNGNLLANFSNAAATNSVLKTDSLQNTLAIPNITAAFVAEKTYDFIFSGANIVSWVNRLTGGYSFFTAGTQPTFNSTTKRLEGIAVNTQIVTSPNTNKFLSGTPFTLIIVEDITASPTSKMLAHDNIIGHQLGYISPTQLLVRWKPSNAQNLYNFTWSAGKKIHVVKRPASGAITWEVNGVNITPASIGITTEVLNFNFMGQFNNNPADGFKAFIMCDREMTANEITTVKTELNNIFP